jgi:signal transduction histidine kinase/ActR/RegA family two-component response regulator
LICIVALLAFVALLAARLRAAAGRIAELREQRERDLDTIARARAEAQSRTQSQGELERSQLALSDAQQALAAVRAERDAATEQAGVAHRQRHAFLAGLAHDLRNPLAPLSNGIELLRLTDNDPAGRLRTRGIMERQVGHLLRIADELSDLARLASGGTSLQSGTFSLGPVLDALAARLGPALQAQDMTLEFSPELRGVPPLQGDAQRLGQAFGQLVDDIARHAERGSTIRIAAAMEEGAATFQVATAEDLAQEQIEPGALALLEEVETPTLGLGVALAGQLAAMHGGRLQGRRPPGTRRVRFALRLPVRGAATGAPAQPVAAPPAGSAALQVLLADDNVDFSHSFGTMLELLGHRVEVVHDGLAALAAIVATPPDIAFIDIGMPSLDGMEAVRRVRDQGNTQEVLLVAVTGRGGAEDRARAAEAGFDRYLVKPFAMQDVRDALDAALAVRHGGAARPAGAFASQATA